MGRLSALIFVTIAALAGCDENKDAPAPVSGRSNAVTAASSPASATTPASTTSAKPAAPRKLCVDTSAHAAPKASVETVAAKGATALPSSVTFGVGKWVWVNLWAAWCGPCKEELPRLQNFQGRLRNAGVMLDLAFVSLDDDKRQLERFLESQPEAGVRASYWLPEDKNRLAWLSNIGVKDATNLPVHALYNPSGQLACLIQGAVEESDFPAIADLVGAKR